ncbi:MAG TPA: hypothetical protein VND21_07670, partial [Planctomycetota bacterium]|nr:hypothetical protein [Planctomycetota bacterium]
LVLLAVVAAGCALPYVVATWELRRSTVDALPAAAVALASLVLGLDLYGREVRRGTHALLLRTPGAMAAAFFGKLAWFLAGNFLAFGVAWLTCRIGTAVTGAPFPSVLVKLPDGQWISEPRDMSPKYVFGVTTGVLLPLVALAVGAWHLLGSLWTRRGGAASLLGALTLAALATPVLILFANHKWWFAFPPTQALLFPAGLLGAALALAVVSWARGRRFLAPARRAYAFGAGGATVLALVLTASVAWAIDRWEVEDPYHPEAGIRGAWLGEGGRYLFLETYRGMPWPGSPSAVAGTRRGTPVRARRVDLVERDDASLAESGSIVPWLPTIGVGQSQDTVTPVPWVLVLSDLYIVVDARTGRDTGQGFPIQGTADIAPLLPRLRDMARAVTPFRDAQGNRVWFLRGRVENVEPDTPPAPGPEGGPRRWLDSVLWDGWAVHDPGRGRAYVPADGGPQVQLALFHEVYGPGSGWSGVDVDGDLYLVHQTPASGDAAAPRGWTLVRWTTGERRPVSGVPDLPRGDPALPHGLKEFAPLVRGAVLRSDAGGLSIWRPGTEDRRPIVVEGGGAERPLAFTGTVRRVAGDRWLLTVATALDPAVARWATGLLDLETGALRRLTPWSARPVRTVALEPEGSVVAIEEDRRVVRFRDGGATREVLYPRPR